MNENNISGATNVRAAVLAVAETRSTGPATINNLAIINNILDGNNDAIEIQDYIKSGSGPATHSSITVTGNEIMNSTAIGVHILSSTSATGIDIHNNKIVNNVLFGANNEGTGTLTATCNWWGSLTGPVHTSNPVGSGDPVSNNIDFTPWLLDGTDGEASVIGFQPIVKTLSVNAGADQNLYIGYGPTSVTLTATVSAGSGNYSYSWLPGGETTQSIIIPLPLLEGTYTYTVAVEDNLGCVNSASDNVNVFVEDVRCGNNNDKVSIWHRKGNGDYVKICVSANAIQTHLAHGDHFGTLGKPNVMGQFAEPPTEFKLNANYPNPFNPTTMISYQVPLTSNVEILVFNSLGEKVAELLNEVKETGFYELEWNASNLSSGIYFYKMIAGEFVNIQKMILMK